MTVVVNLTHVQVCYPSLEVCRLAPQIFNRVQDSVWYSVSIDVRDSVWRAIRRNELVQDLV